jgi:hypothetical protein
VGAEWFAAEFARREEDERLERERAVRWHTTVESDPVPSPDTGLIDASVEDDVVGGAPAGLGIAPMPPSAIRHPHVPRPPVSGSEPAPGSKRRRRDRGVASATTPSPAISAAEWARMSPGARRLYGVDASPEGTGTATGTATGTGWGRRRAARA